MLQHIFRGHRSAWFLMSTSRRFAEFGTPGLAPRYVLRLEVLSLQGQRLNIL